MTTPSPHDSAVRFGATIKQPTASPSETQETDWSNWEKWMAGHKSAVYQDIACELIDPLEQRITALALELAQAKGALDVLRGKGAPGSFRARGVYSSGTAYNYGDVVVKDSSSFVALSDSPGPCPGDGWQMIACGGKRGVQGERGPAGPAGIPPTFLGASFGKRGMEIQTSVGAISLFKSVNVDDKYFTLKFIASDDSTLTINLLPLFEAYHRQTRS
jgi:hypothetical protein